MAISLAHAHLITLPTGNFLVEEVVYNLGQGERFEKTVLSGYARADTGLRGNTVLKHKGHSYVSLHDPVTVHFDVAQMLADQAKTQAHHDACRRLGRALIQAAFPRLQPAKLPEWSPKHPVWEHIDGSVIIELPRTQAIVHLQPLAGTSPVDEPLALPVR